MRAKLTYEMPKDVSHPLKWWTFYVACFRYATTGVWGVIGDVSAVIGFAPPLVKWLTPQVFAAMALYFKAHKLGDELIWKVPLAIGVVILAGRLLVAPYVLYRDKRAATSRDHPRPRVTLEMSHIYYSTMENWTSPIIARNRGDSTAFNISAECVVRDGYVLHIGPVQSVEPASVVGDRPVPAMLRLTSPTATTTASHYNQLLAFLEEASVGLNDALEFDVIYRDFERRMLYRTPHVLRHSAPTRFFVIDLKDAPEPDPEYVAA